MASIFDVMDAMEAMALATCYPNGTAAPSITGRPIDIAQGWPIAEDMDDGLKEGQSFVSVYAVPSSTSKMPVPLQMGLDAVLAAPVHGMDAEATATGFRLYGSPDAREYATVLVNEKPYSAVAGAGGTVQTVAAALASAIPGAAWSPSGSDAVVTIPGLRTLVVRFGAPGTLGRVIDRQQQNVMLGVWAPDPPDRAVIGSALKVAVARNLTVEMPDTSRSIWNSVTENLSDRNQTELAYRYDQTVRVQWDTVDRYEAFEVTSVDFRLSGTTEPSRAD